MAHEGLATYLNDHLAGATAGLKLAELAANEHRSDAHGAFFAELVADIKVDYDVLAGIMDRINVEKSATKSALVEIGSAVMQPKFTGANDAMNAFITVETLSIGVEGKVCMWRALISVDDSNATLARVELEELLERAEDQRSRLEAKRLELAPEALAHTAPV
jgi:hypothetical protein